MQVAATEDGNIDQTDEKNSELLTHDCESHNVTWA